MLGKGRGGGCELCSLRAKKVSKNNEYAEKETLTAPQFIEDSSPTGNIAGMREREAQQHGGIFHICGKSPKGYCGGLELSVW
jgi:hypothetical protein